MPAEYGRDNAVSNMVFIGNTSHEAFVAMGNTVQTVPINHDQLTAVHVKRRPNRNSIVLILFIVCTFFVSHSAQDVALSSLSASRGFRIIGAEGGDESGYSVSNAGDVNGDSVDDIIIGALSANPSSGSDAGISFVLFGRDLAGGASPFGDVQLTIGALPSNTGFRILGAAVEDSSGQSVSAAGDVNGDGVGDILVGAYRANPSGGSNAGISYVIFGRSLNTQLANPFGDIQLTTGVTALPATIGFRILGAATDDYSGICVSAAGDVNGDNIGDILVGANQADPPSKTTAGISYVIFGRNVVPGGATPFGDIQLTTGSTALLSTIGFRILGAAADDESGYAVSTAGDVNGDNVDDVIIGALNADGPYGPSTGISYVIFGRSLTAQISNPFGDIQLTTGTTLLPASIGFRILGAAAGHQSGISVSAAGDVNGDDVGDVIVGAYGADPPVGASAGISYVIFGRNIGAGADEFGDIQLTTHGIPLATNIGFRILGSAIGDWSGFSVSAAGDVNGDSIGDVIVGARFADSPGENDAGISYVIYGRNVAGGTSPFGDIQLTTGGTALSPSIGFRILGAKADDNNGRSVSFAGDMNNDGIDDVIVGAYGADPPAGASTGISYVIYGVNLQPTSKPSSQPSRQPTRQPSSQPSRQPSRQPTQQPTRQPTQQPSRQPTRQPSSQPSRQPSRQPMSLPSSQPSYQPTSFPSTQPTVQPSSQPTAVPTSQPSASPTNQPSSRPSSQPTITPSTQPTCKPSRQPSNQPSQQPSTQPSRQPSAKPSAQPSDQPSDAPSSQPSSQPSHQPNAQPSYQPSSQPIAQPSSQPSSQPNNQPSNRPSDQPSGQPSSQPSKNPSSLPSSQPHAQPSQQPSSQPSTQPSSEPSSLPSSQPSVQPSSQPSCQPSALPTLQPSYEPSSYPSTQPSSLPSSQPSGQPSIQPSMQPSKQPTVQPTARPSAQPSSLPSVQPSGEPSIQPSKQPIVRPSIQPSSLPSNQPCCQPSNQPSTQPTSLPSAKPSAQPSGAPTSLPTVNIYKREWATIVDERVILTRVAMVSNSVWACGTKKLANDESKCIVIGSTLGTPQETISFRWTALSSILQSNDLARVMVTGHTITDNLANTDIADCLFANAQLFCNAKSFEGTSIAAGSYPSFVDKFLYVGATHSSYPSVSIVDGISDTVRSFVYTSTKMRFIQLLHIQSPPVFIGGFVAGTCVSTSGVNFIFAGMVRSDSGVMTGMYIAPTSGSIILNSAELVNYMALEFVNPDSFIAGGLELSDGLGLHTYVVRVNSLYRRVIYGVRYIPHNLPSMTGRRVLLEDHSITSAVKGIVLLQQTLYLISNINHTEAATTRNSVSVLKIDAATGNIEQQVHISAHNASIQCVDATVAGSFLIFGCAVQYPGSTTQAMVLSVSRELYFSNLPFGFLKSEEEMFVGESVAFKSTTLPLSVSKDNIKSTEYTFNTANGYPTIKPSEAVTGQPSAQPTHAPSGQPSSSPTSAPSVSPQPTSQPSSSGPTNTYKPTAKPTPQPTVRPSQNPSTRPSTLPSLSSTVRPSATPTLLPSTSPSANPSSAGPTTAPSAKPTRNPTVRNIRTPTGTPSLSPTIVNSNQSEQRRYMARESAILGYTVAALFGLGCLYQLYRCCQHKVHQVKLDEKRMKEMLVQGLPGQRRYPMFSAAAGLCCAIDIQDIDADNIENQTVISSSVPTVPTAVKVKAKHSTYTGQGANMDGPASFVDLEANELPISNRDSTETRVVTTGAEEEEMSEISGTGDDSAGESRSLSEGSDVILSDESMLTEGPHYETDSYSNEDLSLSENAEHNDNDDGGSDETVIVSEESAHSSELSFESAEQSDGDGEEYTDSMGSNVPSDLSDSSAIIYNDPGANGIVADNDADVD